MNTLAIEIQEARAQEVHVEEDKLVAELVDGRTISAPLAWYPRLWYGTPEERSHFEIIGDGKYIHRADLDEDLSIVGILAGRRSGESAKSFRIRLLKSKRRDLMDLVASIVLDTRAILRPTKTTSTLPGWPSRTMGRGSG